MPVSTRGSRLREQIKAQSNEDYAISRSNMDMLCRAALLPRPNSEPTQTPEQGANDNYETLDYTDDTMSETSTESSTMSPTSAAMCLTQLASKSGTTRFSPEHEGTYIFSTTQ